MKHVFSEGLEPKLIGGAPLSAAELANYVRAYAGMFADGAKFPQAQTMLEATAEANNRNAAGAALEAYEDVEQRAHRLFNVASTWTRARAFRIIKHRRVETAPRDDRSSKNQPKRVEHGRGRSL